MAKPKTPLPKVEPKAGGVNVRKLGLPVGPVTPKPGSMLLEKKRKTPR